MNHEEWWKVAGQRGFVFYHYTVVMRNKEQIFGKKKPFVLDGVQFLRAKNDDFCLNFTVKAKVTRGQNF